MPRANNSGAITFGLVTVPVKFYTAAKSESVSFNMLTEKGNPIKQVWTDSKTGEGVNKADCKKGYKVAKDQWVEFTAEELENLSTEASKAVEIKEFVKRSELHPLAVSKTHYLGPGPGGEKPYGLLSKVMEQLDVVAIAQWTNRTKDHLVAIGPYKGDGLRGLILHELYYANEIRSFSEIGVSNTVDVSEPEMEMAIKLVESQLTKLDASKYKDEFSERVKEAVETKMAGEDIPGPAILPKTTSLDLFGALKASLEADKAKVSA
jgi:DNA end-binding protein Ku